MAPALILVERQTFLELKVEDALPSAPRPRALTDSCCSLGHADSSDSDDGSTACSSLAGGCWRGRRRQSWADMDVESECSASTVESERSASPAGPPGFFVTPQDETLDESSNWTTLVIKQLPHGCTQDSIEDFLKMQGLDRSCNFLYAPTNFRKGTLFGYCFVNFVSSTAARGALQKLNAETTRHSAGKFEQITASMSETHQGLDAQIERYRNCPIMHRFVPDAYKPRLYVEGKIVRFPSPTEPVQLPRGFTKGSLLH